MEELRIVQLHGHLQKVGSRVSLESWRVGILVNKVAALGVQGDLIVARGYELDSSTSTGVLYREDLAAVTVQALLSLDWSVNHVIQVGCPGPVSTMTVEANVAKEWCVNSDRLKSLLEDL